MKPLLLNASQYVDFATDAILNANGTLPPNLTDPKSRIDVTDWQDEIFTRVPDQSLLAEGQQPGVRRISATRDSTGAYAMVYAEQGDPFAVKLNKLSGKEVVAWWFDVRSGKSYRAGVFNKSDSQWFYPPSRGKGNDWVLVLDDASIKFSVPGESNRKNDYLCRDNE